MMRLSLFAAVMLLCATVVRADVESGPLADKDVPALKVFAATGASAGKEIDVPVERAKKTTVYAFVQGDRFSRPMARFLKELDGAMKKRGDESEIVSIWLSEDVGKTKEFLPRVQMSLKFEASTLAVYEKDKLGPGDWTINSDADLTVVVATGGKIVKSFGFVSVNETLAPEVEKALKGDGLNE